MAKKIVVTVHNGTEEDTTTLLLVFAKALSEHHIKYSGPSMANASMTEVHKALVRMSRTISVELTKA